MLQAAGNLNQRVSIYAPKPDAESYMTPDNYDLLATVWADVREITAREQMRAGVDLQSGRMTVQIRFRSGISADCVVKWRGNFYGIDSVSSDRTRGEIIMGCSYSPLNGNRRLAT